MTGSRGFDASRYDAPAPWWFRNAFWVYFPLMLPAVYAGSRGNGVLGLAVVALVALAGLPVLMWDLRHRIKR